MNWIKAVSSPTVTDWIQALSSVITLGVVVFTYKLTRRMSHDPYQALLKLEGIIHGTGDNSKIRIKVKNWGPGIADDICLRNIRTKLKRDTITADGYTTLISEQDSIYIFPAYDIRLQTIFQVTWTTTSGQKRTSYWRYAESKFYRVTGSRRIRSYLLQPLRPGRTRFPQA